MALTKYKLGELIEQTFRQNLDNLYGKESVCGMTITKQIIPTKADVSESDLSKYLVVYPSEFIYNPRTHGQKIGLGYNDTNKNIIISWNNVAFKVKDLAIKILLPEYLYLHLNRSEWDRWACFSSWGSSTEVFSWDAMCDMEIELPAIEVQQKYVDLYNAMVANQKAYEKGLDDLKLVCDGYIEDMRRNMPCEKIGQYLEYHDIRNSENKCINVKGVTVYKNFREPTSKVNREELRGYKIVKPTWITFVQTTHNEKVFAYALNNTGEDVVVSSVNEVFSTKTEKLLPEYLCMFFNRKEFDRYARYHSWGSARETFTWNDLLEVAIPVPDIKIQQSIVDIYNQYIARKELNEKLKAQIKDLCPILIKGSLQDHGVHKYEKN